MCTSGSENFLDDINGESWIQCTKCKDWFDETCPRDFQIINGTSYVWAALQSLSEVQKQENHGFCHQISCVVLAN